MMGHRLDIEPKNPQGPLMVIVIGRVSTPQQNLTNIEASYEDDERYLRSLYSDEIHIKRLGEQGSGWKVNRATINEALEEIKTGKWDVVVAEDLGRAYRNPQFQYMIAHLCVDHDTRLICPGDHLDTGESMWEASLGTAVLRHALHVPDTRRRVKRTATYAFHRGGMVLKTPFAYRRLTEEEAESGEHGPKGLRLARISSDTPIIQEMRNRVLRGESYADIARWLNDTGIPVPPYVTCGRWTGRLVADLLRNKLLQGVRTFREMEYQLIFSSGEHRRKRNPAPEVECIPELAHLTKEEQDELWAAMDRHAPPRGPHPRKGTARKHSYWPGQHLRCAICGAELHWCGRSKLKCSNVLPGGPRTCWNHVQVNAEQVRGKLLPSLLSFLRSRPELQNLLIDAAWSEFQRATSRSRREQDGLEHRRQELLKDRERIMSLLIKHSESEGLHQRLDATESELRGLQSAIDQKRALDQTQAHYLTRDDLAERLDQVVLHLARTSYNFRSLLRRTFPDFLVMPVQALDTHQVHPRVKLVVPPFEEGKPATTIVVDAFDAPKQIRYAVECQRLKELHPDKTLAQIGQMLGVSKKVVCDALKFARLMVDRNATEPYIELTAKPEKASRWRQASSRTAGEVADHEEGDVGNGGRSGDES